MSILKYWNDVVGKYNNREKTIKFTKWNIFAAFIFGVSHSYAQQYAPDDTVNKSYVDNISKSYPVQNELFLSRLKAETSDKKRFKYYASNYEAIFKALNDEIKDGQVIYIPSIAATLNKALLEIKTNNPDLPRDIEAFLLREDDPNAYTIGDNHLFLNLGLFYYLENEDQIASVLAHEIAHLMLKHTLKALDYNYEKDKESITYLKEVQEEEIKKADRAFSLLKNSIYKQEAVARAHEMQADSLGYILFKNTRYPKAAFVEALKIIACNDTVRQDGLNITVYKQLFNLPDQPFKDTWLRKEDFSSYHYEAFSAKLDKDSISSHPKIQERIHYLTGLFPELTQQENSKAADTLNTFYNVRNIARMQYVPNLFFREQYGAIIYVSLLHLQKNPDDTLYRDWLGKGFQKIYEARKHYQLNRYLDRISPKEQTESYMQFLNFMWNLKLEEIKNIATFYSPKGDDLHQ